MTATAPHEPHVSRHLEQLIRIRGPERVKPLLERSDLTFEQGHARKRSGGELDEEDCVRYLAAVKEVLGDSVYSFTKANFTLARCSCCQRDL